MKEKRRTNRLVAGSKAVASLPKYLLNLEHENKSLKERLDELLKNNHLLTEDVINVRNHTAAEVDRLQGELFESNNKLANLDDRLSDVLHQISHLSAVAPAQQSTAELNATNKNGKLLADNHLLDNFYVEFENNFRGTEAEIRQRLEVYIPYLEPIRAKTTKYPIIDIGCGRGEFAELMQANQLRCIGLDLNEAMVKRVNEKGGEAIEANAIDYLSDQPTKSIGAITGFHLIEHLPFDALIKLFDECYRTLIKDGLVIFETPNPENLLIGSCNFYMDPSHLHPLPPGLTEFAIKTRGFSKVEVLRLHPRKMLKLSTSDAAIKELAGSIYGPQDYAIIAYK